MSYRLLALWCKIFGHKKELVPNDQGPYLWCVRCDHLSRP